MKRFVPILVFICLVLCSFPVFAHSGRTDANGGHYDRSTGEYHYHHGYSAHQHPGGVCPYEDNPYFEDEELDFSGTAASPSPSKSMLDQAYESSMERSKAAEEKARAEIARRRAAEAAAITSPSSDPSPQDILASTSSYTGDAWYTNPVIIGGILCALFFILALILRHPTAHIVGLFFGAFTSLAAIAGIFFYFYGLHFWTIICASLCLGECIFGRFIGELKSFITLIVAVVIAFVVSIVAYIDLVPCIALALCIEAVLTSIAGWIMVLMVSKRRK